MMEGLLAVIDMLGNTIRSLNARVAALEAELAAARKVATASEDSE